MRIVEIELGIPIRHWAEDAADLFVERELAADDVAGDALLKLHVGEANTVSIGFGGAVLCGG